jgi:hypothetical protein
MNADKRGLKTNDLSAFICVIPSPNCFFNSFFSLCKVPPRKTPHLPNPCHTFQIVGRTPWSAADALVGLFATGKSRDPSNNLQRFTTLNKTLAVRAASTE